MGKFKLAKRFRFRRIRSDNDRTSGYRVGPAPNDIARRPEISELIRVARALESSSAARHE